MRPKMIGHLVLLNYLEISTKSIFENYCLDFTTLFPDIGLLLFINILLVFYIFIGTHKLHGHNSHTPYTPALSRYI